MVGVAGGLAEVVEDHHDGAVGGGVEFGDEVEHVELVAQVEEGGRLVEKEQRRVLGEREGDPGALALAAGEVVDGEVAQGGRPGARQGGLDGGGVGFGPGAQGALVGVAAEADEGFDADAFGGDGLLREIGQVLQLNVRSSDVACRYGGEEFVVILPGADPETARARAERLRELVEQVGVAQAGRLFGPMTMSVGLAAYPDHGLSGRALLEAADRALYDAKQQGRNRVITATPL